MRFPMLSPALFFDSIATAISFRSFFVCADKTAHHCTVLFPISVLLAYSLAQSCVADLDSRSGNARTIRCSNHHFNAGAGGDDVAAGIDPSDSGDSSDSGGGSSDFSFEDIAAVASPPLTRSDGSSHPPSQRRCITRAAQYGLQCIIALRRQRHLVRLRGRSFDRRGLKRPRTTHRSTGAVDSSESCSAPPRP